MIDRSEWLKGIKVGDEVVIEQTNARVRIERITKVTKAWVWVGPSKFSRAYGREPGSGGYVYTSIDPVTNEHREEVALRRYERWLRDMAATLTGPNPSATLTQLRAMHRAYKETK